MRRRTFLQGAAGAIAALLIEWRLVPALPEVERDVYADWYAGYDVGVQYWKKHDLVMFNYPEGQPDTWIARREWVTRADLVARGYTQ